MNRRGRSGYDIGRESIFIICAKKAGAGENSVRGSFELLPPILMAWRRAWERP